MRLLAICLLLGLLAGCSQARTYHYSIHVLKPALIQTAVESGEGNPAICKHLFKPPVYIGPVIDIPPTAQPFGVMVVTDGNTSAIVPLFTWSDEKGAKQYGCNGPSPRFAQSARTGEELIRNMRDLLGKKTSNA